MKAHVEPDVSSAITKIEGWLQAVVEEEALLEEYLRTGKELSPLARYRYLKSKKDFLVSRLRMGAVFQHQPMTPREFFTSAEGMDAEKVLYPKVLDALCRLNHWVWDPALGIRGRYYEAVLTGSIGSAKTTVALYTTAYQTHLLGCLKEPHRMWGLDPDSEILQILQSATGTLAETVDYERLRSMMDRAPWFRNHFPFSPDQKSRMIFPNRVIIRPVSTSETAALSQNVIGGIVDEINFMQRVENSKRSHTGDDYDQAVSLYNSISRRRESRFMSQGWVAGMLCLVSSRKYPGEFTERKEQEAVHNERIYVYDKRHWDIAPEGTYTGHTFPLFVGDDTRNPKVLESPDDVPEADQELVMQVPVEVKKHFEGAEIYDALRDIVGVSTRSLHPFMYDVQSLHDAFGKVSSVFGRLCVDLERVKCQILPEQFMNLKCPRFVHVDLGLKEDSAGLAVGYIEKFLKVERGDETEILPMIVFDGVLEIEPPLGKEIQFHKIRMIIYKLKELGLPIKWVSYDSYQSTDSLQLLKQKGFTVGLQSLDKKTIPYRISKAAFIDRRVMAPEHPKAQKEWAHLEKNVEKDKVDHPPKGSKDLSDSMAGVIYGLHMRREIWLKHGVLSSMRAFQTRWSPDESKVSE